MSNYRNLILSLLALGLYTQPAMGAPFCITSQTIKPQCDYTDAAECRQRADQIKGLCVANPKELTIRRGTGKYCLVDSGRVPHCIYSDRTSCDNEAVRHGAVCIESVQPMVQEPLYQRDPNRKY